jgi:multidrug resistance efflux pump
MLIVASAAAAAGLAATFALTRPGSAVIADRGPAIPTGRVVRGSLALTVHLKGDFRAARQQAIMAPAVGTSLRILTLVDSGSAVKEGDVIVEFDPADQLYALEQAQSELLEAEQEMIQRRASTAAQVAQDKVALLTEQFNVRRAELDSAVDKDLIPANDYQIRQATLQEARRTLEQTERDVKTRADMGAAGLAVLQEKHAKAKLLVDRAQQNIESLVIKATMDGVISVRENTDAAGGIYFSGMTLPQYRVGDTVSPGRPMIDIFDVSGMEIRASVNEQERDNVAPGQVVQVVSNVAPGPPFNAKVTAVSGLGQADRTAGPLRMFDVTLALDHADARLRPGTSVEVIVPGKTVENVLLLPRQAIFEKEGKPTVYERTAAGFEPRQIKVLHRTESRVALEGIAEGVEVALVDPALAPSGGGAAKAPSGSGLGK